MTDVRCRWRQAAAGERFNISTTQCIVQHPLVQALLLWCHCNGCVQFYKRKGRPMAGWVADHLINIPRQITPVLCKTGQNCAKLDEIVQNWENLPKFKFCFKFHPKGQMIIWSTFFSSILIALFRDTPLGYLHCILVDSQIAKDSQFWLFLTILAIWLSAYTK